MARRGFTLALLGGLLVGCNEAKKPLVAPSILIKPPKTSILLITIDTLRADHLSLYGYFRKTSKNIDAFAAQSVVFENAVTPMSTTLPAHISMFTSTRPRKHGVVRNGLVFEPSPDLVPVAQTFKEIGYVTAGFVSASPVSRGTGAENGFDHFDDAGGEPQRAEATVDRFLAWLGARKEKTPFFAWIHLWDPHAPYEPPESHVGKYNKTPALQRFLEERKIPLEKTLGKVDFDVQDIHNRYDEEILYMDEQIGRLFKRLKSMGQFDETAMVLAADHGEGLWQHNWHDHGQTYNEQLFVPLIFKAPKSYEIKPDVRGGLASTMDIVPTLVGMLALQLPEGRSDQFEGVDLMFGEESRKFVFSERVHRHRKGWKKGEKRVLIDLDWKYVSFEAGKETLYNMRTDRFELHNVLDEHPVVARGLARQLQGVLATYATEKRAERRDVDSRLMMKLKALGYVE